MNAGMNRLPVIRPAHAVNDNEALGLPPVPLLKQLLKPLAEEVIRSFPTEDPASREAGSGPEPG